MTGRAKTAAMTQELARAFEKGITEHPDDWHMLQRVFTADLDPARLAAQATAGGEPEISAPENGPGNGTGAGL